MKDSRLYVSSPMQAIPKKTIAATLDVYCTYTAMPQYIQVGRGQFRVQRNSVSMAKSLL